MSIEKCVFLFTIHLLGFEGCAKYCSEYERAISSEWGFFCKECRFSYSHDWSISSTVDKRDKRRKGVPLSWESQDCLGDCSIQPAAVPEENLRFTDQYAGVPAKRGKGGYCAESGWLFVCPGWCRGGIEEENQHRSSLLLIPSHPSQAGVRFALSSIVGEFPRR